MFIVGSPRYLDDYVKKFNIKITPNTKVEKVSRKDLGNGEKEFVIRTENGPTYHAKVLIMACGAMKEKLPNIPGIELATPYSIHSVKQEDYINKKISIIGGGNSGFEVLMHTQSISSW